MSPRGEPEAQPRVSVPGTSAAGGSEPREATLTEQEELTFDPPAPPPRFGPGSVLGDRYRIHSQLGRGGMGEVWRAFDLKLRVEVALKTLLPGRLEDERRRDLLRREVRAAREVLSPNVCRIFDLVEVDGRELVSMEYVDGGTLLDLLREKGPLELRDAQAIAAQFLAGLEAIHGAGLVHRDVKPENIMITRTGRVVVMDFGLARGEDEGSATVAGTPAYMAPEQERGEAVDARADVFAAGVVLTEMISPDGVADPDSRRSLWRGVRADPPRLPDSPWLQVLRTALARTPEDRYPTAHSLIRALEEVTLRVEGTDDLTPYPGLASFTASDAEFFFGREVEVEQVWRKLEQPRLLAIIGPSGAGKSSFLHAGLIPSAPPGWAIVHCVPGTTPVLSLSRALAPAIAGDPEAMDLLLRFDDTEVAVETFARWRHRHGQALLIVDQLEELFTLNPSDVQERFADLLGRLALDADVHVLLSLRDDFFFHCHHFPAFAPLLDGLTLLGPPTGAALRRALVQPATACGYRFEDDELIEEVLAEVEGERGALPLMAFAIARLWDARERDSGLLTRRAYGDLGGVSGALARHAEATLERIGSQGLPTVREIFRNLVTAEATRAVREIDELLSVFDPGDREPARRILAQLVDARLLTSYEVHGDDLEPIRRVEIIHESLLTSWPRLVRWRSQDEDGARLRDELRQAARAWHEHGRPEDRLWTGTAFAEFQLWRERYPGGLSELEEAFARAMTALAGRRRRRRRIAVFAAFAVLLAVLTVVGVAWRRSVLAVRRADAHKVVTLGELKLMSSSISEALAHAIASLELMDTEEARHLALKVLWQRPPTLRIPQSWGPATAFSPDGSQLAVGGHKLKVELWGSAGGDPIVLLPEAPEEGSVRWVRYSADQRLLFAATGKPGTGAQLWSLENRRLLRSFDCGGEGTDGFLSDDETRLVTATTNEGGQRKTIRTWPLPKGEPTILGELPTGLWSIDPTRGRVGFSTGGELRVLDLDDLGGLDAAAEAPPGDRIVSTGFDGSGERLASAHESGMTRVWSLEASPPTLVREMRSGSGAHGVVGFSPDGSWLATRVSTAVYLHDLERPQESAPLVVGLGGSVDSAAFDPHSRWLAVSGWRQTQLVPLDRRYPTVMEGHKPSPIFLAFAPDGTWLASASWDRSVRLWPVAGGRGIRARLVHTFSEEDGGVYCLAVSPDGRFLATGTGGGGVWLVPVDGGEPRLVGLMNDIVQAVAVSPDGGTIAAGGGTRVPEDRFIHLWDLDSGGHRSIDPGDDSDVRALEFLPDGRLVSATGETVRRWDLADGTDEVLLDHGARRFDVTSDGSGILVNRGIPWGHGTLHYLSLADGRSRRLEEYGRLVRSVAVDGTGTIAVTGDMGGPLRVGRIGEEPHLLYAAQYADVWGVAISPDRRWIASSGRSEDGAAVYLWPMPDLDRPPLHTLPHEELVATLKTLTNERMVRSEESPDNWVWTLDPFPGWDTVPTW